MAKGSGAAFNKLQTPNDSLSQTMQFWGSQQNRINAEQKASQERAQVREQQKRAKLSENLGFDPENLKGKFTGQKDFDAVTRTFSENIVDKVANYEMMGNEALSKGDYQEYNKLLSQSKKAQAAISNWNGMSEKVGEQIKTYMGKATEGKLNPNDNRSMIFDAVLKHNYIPDVDENGNFSLLVGVDRDGDGVVSKEEKEAGEAFLEGGEVSEGYEFHVIDPYKIVDGEFRAFEKVDLTSKNGLIGELANNIGMASYDGEVDANGNPQAGGSFVRNFEGFDGDKLPQLEVLAESKLLDPETLSWVHSQATGSKKIFTDVDDATEEEINAAKKFLVEGAVNSFDTKEGMKYNWSKDASARGWAREKRQRDKEEGEGIEAELATTTTGEPVRVSDGEMRPQDDPMSSGREFTLKTKGGKPLKGIISNSPSTEVLTIQQIGDKYFASVRQSADDLLSLGDETEVKVEQVQLTDTELNRLARGFDLKDASELNEYLDKRAQKSEKTKKPTPQELISKYRSK